MNRQKAPNRSKAEPKLNEKIKIITFNIKKVPQIKTSNHGSFRLNPSKIKITAQIISPAPSNFNMSGA